jgi:WD40 repeat protein
VRGKGIGKMKRIIIITFMLVLVCSFSSQLLALPEGAIARLGKGTVKAVAFSPDGKYLAVAGSIGIWLYDAKTYQEVKYLESYSPLTSVSFSPDGSMLASGSYDKTIKLWEVKSGNLIRTLTGHTNHVISVSFSPDGSMLASGSGDKTIKLWEVKSGNLIRTLAGHRDRVYSVSFSPDGSMVASGS